jgi:hypothetical protein
MNLPGLQPLFRSLYQESVPGRRVNEDGLGLHGRYAWVIDGATGLSEDQKTPGDSDAAWLADRIDTGLRALSAMDLGADEILSRLEAWARSDYDRASAPIANIPDEFTPSACLGLIKVEAQDGALLLEGRFLGDVIALVPSDNGILRWTDERSKPFEAKTLDAFGAERLGVATRHMPEAVLKQILQNRTRLNRPDGYWVVNPRRPWAGQELRFQARVRSGDPVVLATDGFMRLVDVFGAYTDKSLHAALAAGGGDELIRELRSLESRDPMAAAHLRVKTHDDASVLVIAAEL